MTPARLAQGVLQCGVACIAALAACFLVPVVAQAQNYPDRAIRVIVAVPAGGGVDTVTRLIGQKLQERLGQPVVIENRGGAAGNIGAEVVANAAPDGYTLLATPPAPLVANAALYKKLRFDPEGFEPVAIMSLSPNVLVASPDAPVKSVAELIAYAKANPGKLRYGSQGNGTTSHLTTELFQRLTHTQLLHVPYRGTAPALNDLIASHVDLMFVDVTAVLPFRLSGQARILAVATHERLPDLPDVPTLEELGLAGFFSAAWNAVVAPPRTPAAITARLNAEINAVLKLPEVEAQFRALRLVRMGGTRSEMAAFMREERERWEGVIRGSNLSLE
ncbi:MAG TPA: tripartite tricarboxylate transporter substrate binding protein [Xanthobacteraceae bacterium]|nr:tripartite tricarboxylate transporter substrate binding protein [Xanthobacteraceae bacterium]